MAATETANDRFFGRREVRPVGAPVVPQLIKYIKLLSGGNTEKVSDTLPTDSLELATAMGVKQGSLNQSLALIRARFIGYKKTPYFSGENIPPRNSRDLILEYPYVYVPPEYALTFLALLKHISDYPKISNPKTQEPLLKNIKIAVEKVKEDHPDEVNTFLNGQPVLKGALGDWLGGGSN